MNGNGSTIILICRTCLKLIDTVQNATSINECTELNSKSISIRELIRMCVSEMNLTVSDNVVICDSCLGLLRNLYLFRIKCLQTEERIHSYMEEKNVTVSINLWNLLASAPPSETVEEKEIICLSDSDKVYESSSSDKEHRTVLDGNYDAVVNETSDVHENEGGNKESSCTPTSLSFVRLKKQYLCDKCEYNTDRRRNLIRHLRNHGAYRCNMCSFQCSHENYFIEHMSIHDTVPYVCGMCDKKFARKHYIRLHILYKHSEFLMTYHCQIADCNKVFNRKIDFNAHIVKHTTYKPFVCQLCRKVFFNVTQWNHHMEHVHLLNGMVTGFGS